MPWFGSPYSLPVSCSPRRGGRFGAHSSNESMDPVYCKKRVFISFFDADERCVKIDGKVRCRTAIQTNNVETDARGYIYIVDRANTGMRILELSGEARPMAGLK